MTHLVTSPRYVNSRVLAAPFAPDGADPANPPPTAGLEAFGFDYVEVYWEATAGAGVTDDDTITVRMLGFDYGGGVWTRIATRSIRHREKLIVPAASMATFPRVDAFNVNVGVTGITIRISGYTPEGQLIALDDYVVLPELPATFAPGGAAGVPDTGFLFTREVAGTTELFYEDSAGNITQLTGGGAIAGLQFAYDLDPSIVTSAVVGPLGGPVSISKGAGTAVGDSAFYVADLNVVINRTAPLVLIEDNNDGGATGFPTVEVRKNNSTNSGVNLLLSGADLGALGPILRLFHNSGSPANNDVVGRLSFAGNDATPAIVEYARIDGRASDVTAGVADGNIDLYVRRSGIFSRVALISAITGAAQTGLRVITQAPASGNGAFEFWATSDFLAGQAVFRILDDAGGTPLLVVDGDGDTTITSTQGGATGVELRLYQDSPTPMAGDIVGQVTFFGEDVGSAVQQYAAIQGEIIDTSATEDGAINFVTVTGGTVGRPLQIRGGGAAAEQRLIFFNQSAPGAGVGFLLSFMNDVAAGGQAFFIEDAAAGGPGAGTTLFFVGGDGTVRSSFAGSATLSSYGLSSDPNTGLVFPAADSTALLTGGVQTLTAAVDVVTCLSTNAGTTGIELQLYQDSATPTGGDLVGLITFYGEDGGGAKQQYAQIDSRIVASGAGVEEGSLRTHVMNLGTLARVYTVRADGGAAAAERGAVFQNFLAAGATNIQFEFRLSEDSATVGPRVTLFRERTIDAVDADAIGCIDFDGMDDGTPTRLTYARIAAIITDSANASEDGALELHFVNTGTMVRTARYSGATNAIDTGLVQECFLAAGAANYQHELLLTDATATAGPIISLRRMSASPANNDHVGAIAWLAQTVTPTTLEYARMYVRLDTVDPASSTTSTFIFNTVAGAAVVNEAVRFDSGGQIHADLGAGTGNVTVFDDYDDALILREMFPVGERKQEALDRLVDMGVCSRKPDHDDGQPNGSGYMVNFQKMFALLGGGIYQTREKVDELAAENAMLRARIVALEAAKG